MTAGRPEHEPAVNVPGASGFGLDRDVSVASGDPVRTWCVYSCPCSQVDRVGRDVCLSHER